MNYEIVRFKQGLNTRILIHCINQYKMHWHKELEIILVLKGEIELIVNGVRYELKEDEFFFINSGQVHSTSGHGDNIIVAIQINLDAFDRTYPQIKNTVFEWPNSQFINKDDSILKEFRSYIAKMVGEYRRGEKGYQVAVESHLNALFTLILRYIPQTQKKETPQYRKDLQRLQSVIEYVEEHYTEKITLEQIAKNEYISTFYLSHFFKEKMGIPFFEYLNYVRLNKSIALLDKCADNINNIALDCGFANVKSFNKVFKDAYGITPGEYKKANQINISNDTDRVSYMEFDSFQALSKLENYIQTDQVQATANIFNKEVNILSIDLNCHSTPFLQWKRLAAVGRAYDCMRGDLQEQIHLAKKELGIEYLRFHGIFSDEMRVATRNKGGKLDFYWQYVDIVLDFLINIGIRPFIDFTFMPTILSSKDTTVFWYQGNISKPKDIEEWKELVHHFTTHCINRYGIIEVRKWYFEIWNEPDYMWAGTKKDFYELYRSTVHILRSIDDKLKIAGPSVLSPIRENSSFANGFVDFVNKENLPLDAFVYHIYGENDYALQQGSIISRLGDKQHFSDCINEFGKIASKLKVPVKEIFITEYNISTIHNNFLLDTMFAATHMLYNFLKNHSKVNGIATWTLSDIFEEDSELKGPFYGGFGMMTVEGIRKPTWYAQWFLSLLGDEIISQGEDYIITRKEEDIQILAFNYVFYDKLYIAGDRSLLKYDSRYNVFEYQKDINYNFTINNIDGIYEKRVYNLDREHGSAYDIFERMGSPEVFSREDAEYIKCKARPQMSVSTISVDNQLDIELQLPMHGIGMIQLRKKYL